MRNSLLFFALIFSLSCSSNSPKDLGGLLEGEGWTLINSDTKVDLTDYRNPKFESQITLEFTGSGSSNGPLLVMNAYQDVVEFGDIDLEDHKVEKNYLIDEFPNRKFCRITREKKYQRGEQIRIKIPVELIKKNVLLFHFSDDFTTSSWVNAWYPTPFNQEDGLWPSLKVRGTLKLMLPPDWLSIAGGELIENEKSGDATIQTWRLNGETSQSFAAGRWKEFKYEFEDDEISLLGFSRNIEGQQARVNAFLKSLQIFKDLFGDPPYKYQAIVEVPFSVPGFYGASEQQYILLKSQAFNDQLNSLPVLAHEAAHAWWATKVGVAPGENAGLWLSESIAQYSAVLAIEEVHGEEAAINFMLNGTGGFSSNHDASAYHRFRRNGNDVAIMELTAGQRIDHYIADSKGTWIYHMLRKKVGDQAFFGSLKKLATVYANQNVTIGEWKKVFSDATDTDLDRFFQQWLEWEGVPVLTSETSGNQLKISQQQSGKAYELDLPIRIEFKDGQVSMERVVFAEKKQVYHFDKQIASAKLDPNHDLLILQE